MSKKTIGLDLPMQIGCFVYQYSKLRMFQFCYDFVDVFVDRRDFENCTMDTDSVTSLCPLTYCKKLSSQTCARCMTSRRRTGFTGTTLQSIQPTIRGHQCCLKKSTEVMES